MTCAKRGRRDEGSRVLGAVASIGEARLRAHFVYGRPGAPPACSLPAFVMDSHSRFPTLEPKAPPPLLAGRDD